MLQEACPFFRSASCLLRLLHICIARSAEAFTLSSLSDSILCSEVSLPVLAEVLIASLLMDSTERFKLLTSSWIAILAGEF